uniref:KIB1-4 beta-propeller domain-containing protein n=1 Tax=Oryza glaberrima TaxID=4538 RepID=I1QVJ9_ORYGL
MESAWTNLPGEIMELIADKASDALTGRALSRSVCRSWRAAVPETPRLLLPAAAARGAGDEYALVFPLSRGWSVVVDVRDTSCRLSHLATGATAPLPRLNAVRATAGSRVVPPGARRRLAPADAAALGGSDEPGVEAELPAARHGARRHRRRTVQDQDQVSLVFHVPRIRPPTLAPLRRPCPGGGEHGRHADHDVPPGSGDTGMVFCRPGDAAWTKLDNHIDDDKHVYNLVEFAYLDGKVFAMDRGGTTAVIDAATLEVLDLVDAPPGTRNVSNKLLGTANGDDTVMSLDYLHLVALPSKLLVVRVRVNKSSSEPEGFDVFELGRQDHRDGEGKLAWREVAGDDVGGNYDLFLDDHHATFGGGGGGAGGDSGSRIYYVHDGKEAYCYSKRHGELECVYSSPEGSEEQCSTMPSWFVP